MYFFFIVSAMKVTIGPSETGKKRALSFKNVLQNAIIKSLTDSPTWP